MFTRCTISASLTVIFCLMFIILEEMISIVILLRFKDMVGCDRVIPPNAANLKVYLKGPLLSICFSNMN